jgi:hypothetical protein
MMAPNLNMIFADYGVPYSGRCRIATGREDIFSYFKIGPSGVRDLSS